MDKFDWNGLFKNSVPNCVGVDKMERLTGGAVNALFRVFLKFNRDGTEETVEKYCVRARGLAPGTIPFPLSVEADLMQLCATVNAPAPKIYGVYSHEKDGIEALLMEWLDGEALGQRIVKMDFDVDLTFNAGQTIARIHKINLDGTLSEKLLPQQSFEISIDKYYEQLQASNIGVNPGFEYVFRWLRENVPPPLKKKTLVHGDYRNGNLMMTKEKGIVGVLDWELACIGDPMADLGWMCVNSWRFGNIEMNVGGFGNYEKFFAGYESEGLKVDRERVKFWQIQGQIMWAVMCLGFGDRWIENKKFRRMEPAAIARRAAEGVLDSLNDIIPLATLLKAGTDGNIKIPNEVTETVIRGTRHPDASDLLSAVQDLFVDLKKEVKGPSKYYLSVAKNMLAMGRRELVHSRRMEVDEENRIGTILERFSLLVDDYNNNNHNIDINNTNRLLNYREKLGVAIREKIIGLDEEELQIHLWITASERMYIANPKYSGLLFAKRIVEGDDTVKHLSRL